MLSLVAFANRTRHWFPEGDALMPRIAINGLGRMGKLVLRAFFEEGRARRDRAPERRGGRPGAARAPARIRQRARPLARAPSRHDAESVSVNGTRMLLSNAARHRGPAARGLRDRPGGRLHRRLQDARRRRGPTSTQGSAKWWSRRRSRRTPRSTSSTASTTTATIRPRHELVTAASCTTNCLAPVVKVLHEEIGIRHGSITTMHDVTNTQTIVDRPAKDLRRARSALTSLIPTPGLRCRSAR